MKKSLKNRWPFTISKQVGYREPDFQLIGGVLLMAIVGLIMVYNSSVAIAVRDFGNQYYYLKEQLKWLILGLTSMIIVSFVPYHAWKKYTILIVVANILSLLAVFLPFIGIKALGASRWVRFGPLVFQPAEMAKFTSILYLGKLLTSSANSKLSKFIFYLILVSGLVVIEPDLGTTIVLSSVMLAIYITSNTPIWHTLVLVPLMILSGIFFALSSPYRMQRVMTFLHPDKDPLGSSYQIRQALIAIGSGGLFGVGFGQSRQKYAYLPESNTDSIFAIFAEEMGLVGNMLLIFLFVFIIFRGLRIAGRVKDDYGRIIAVGITAWIGIQAVLNLTALTGMMPLTGIPLPFISYGGSSLVLILTAVGVLLNISRHI